MTIILESFEEPFEYPERYPDEDEGYLEDDQDDEEHDANGCDRCSGSIGQGTGLFLPVCACATGQGAPPELCRCGQV